VNVAPTSTRLPQAGISWPHLVPVVLLGWWTLSASGSERPYLFIDGVNLAFHEAGHLAFAPFGSTLGILGGTLGQLLVPALLVAYFLLKQRSPLSAAICSWWVGESLTNVAVYMADARELKLDLVGGGEHDWNRLFYQFGLLGQGSVERVSGLTHVLGVVLMLAGLAWILYFVLPAEKKETVAARLTDRLPALRVLFED
jgi:hypothetical protein